MKTKTLVFAVFAAALMANGVAYAQRDDHRDDHRDARPGDQRFEGRRNDRFDDMRHDWKKGDRLPTEYRGHTYVVNNWRDHHLHQPPRGYQWVQVGGQYALIAAATGLIAELINQ